MTFSWEDPAPDDFSVAVDIRRTCVDHVDSPHLLEISIIGELDLATGPMLISAVADAETASTPAALVRFRLDQLDFIDAAGLTALTTVAAGRPVQIVGATSAARRLFAITGVSSIFDID
ncbi:MAG: STAS domain-containing protein [Ilumatobacteraceae bacterium]